MVVGGVAHAANYVKVTDADGTLGLGYGTTAYSWMNTWGDNDIRCGYSLSGGNPYQNRRAIMRFDINWAAVPTTITAATLEIDTMSISTDSTNVKLALVTTGSFTGSNPPTDFLNYDGGSWTGGDPDTANEIAVTLASYTSYSIDILSLINIWKANQTGNYGLIFYDDTPVEGAAYSRIYSSETPEPPDPNAHQDPTIVIVPEPVSLSLLALGGVGVLLRRRR